MTNILITDAGGAAAVGVLKSLKSAFTDEPSMLDYYFNQPPPEAVDVTGEETSGVSLGHLQKYHMKQYFFE